MIVPVTSEKYRNLFADAELFLGLAEGTIDSLNAYYGYMKDFYNKAAQDSKGYKFVMMPIDEEVFDINLNTRAISIPAAFVKTSGIQADQMAELIVFEADRYFDYMDLANTLIYVQWQLPNNNHTTGATAITMKDLESKPGKIRFAWPLHDTITQYQGVVKFSVRFYLMTEEKDKDGAIQRKLAYALNTLDANLTIRPALNPTADILPEAVGGLFEKAIINSQYTGDGQIPPIDPTFGEPGLDMSIPSENFVRYLTEVESPTKTQVAKLVENELVLKAQAVVGDAGKLTYDWKFAKDGEKFDDGSLKWNSLETQGEIVLEKATLPIDTATGKPYLSFRDAYFDADGNPYVSTEVPEDIDLYEKYVKYSLPTEGDVVGYYAVGAKNSLGNPVLTSSEIWSSRCYLPGPADIKFAPKVFTEEVIEGQKNIKVNIIEDINSPTIDYTWYYSALSSENVINSAENGIAAEGVTITDMANLIPGWYAARVSANLNRKDKFAGTPEPYTVYAKAEITDIVPSETDVSIQLEPGETATLKVNVIVPAPEGFTEETIADALYKNLQYKWQYNTVDNNVWRDVRSEMISATDPAKPVVSVNTDGSLTVRRASNIPVIQFKCIVTNTLGNKDNSVTKTQESEYTIV